MITAARCPTPTLLPFLNRCNRFLHRFHRVGKQLGTTTITATMASEMFTAFIAALQAAGSVLLTLGYGLLAGLFRLSLVHQIHRTNHKAATQPICASLHYPT